MSFLVMLVFPHFSARLSRLSERFSEQLPRG
jgi:hypothetical protein